MSKELAIKPDASVAGMLHAVIERGVTQDNVAALEKLCDLYERMQTKAAEKDFAVAMVALQSETIRVQATKAVDVKNGVPRYTFAPYEEIMRVVQPMLTRHGFSITFDTKIESDRLWSSCTLTHSSGISRVNQFAVRFTTPPGSSNAQGDMSTKSYAKRGALCDALNITIDHDDDARAEGGLLSPSLAEELKLRVRATGSDEAKFLKFAGAASFEEIREAKYPMLDDFLSRKEVKVKPPEEAVKDR